MGVADVKQRYVYTSFSVDKELLYLCILLIQFISIVENMKITGI